MKKSKINVSIVLDTRRKRMDGKYPIKLRVTFQRMRKYYGTGQEANQDEWERINAISVRGGLKRIKRNITEIEEEAFACCEKLDQFCFKGFEKAFLDDKIAFESVSSAVQSYIKRLRKKIAMRLPLLTKLLLGL